MDTDWLRRSSQAARAVPLLRRLDRLPATPAVGLGLFSGAAVGLSLVVLSFWPALVTTLALLLVATALTLTAEPVAVPARAGDRRHHSSPTGAHPGEERVHEADGTVLVYVPAGEYTLGAEDLDPTSRPVHTVHLSGFWIGKHPVTNGQYAKFLEANPGQEEPRHWPKLRFHRKKHPVVGVSWFDAKAYCEWAGLTLPTEAQWEAAARGTDERCYPWGDDLPTAKHAVFGRSGLRGATTKVGTHPSGAGPFGTLDQAGNVWEWCADGWNDHAYERRDGKTNPVESALPDSDRVLRGGAWSYQVWDLAAPVRARTGVRTWDRSIGFRCVLPTEQGADLKTVLVREAGSGLRRTGQHTAKPHALEAHRS